MSSLVGERRNKYNERERRDVKLIWNSFSPDIKAWVHSHIEDIDELIETKEVSLVCHRPLVADISLSINIENPDTKIYITEKPFRSRVTIVYMHKITRRRAWRKKFMSRTKIEKITGVYRRSFFRSWAFIGNNK